MDDYYVEADNPVRFIDAFVDGLDLTAAGFVRVEAKATGRLGYAPGDLLKLYIYGYLNRVRFEPSVGVGGVSPQHRGHLAVADVLKPDFKTIADFRRDNRGAFKSVFRQLVLLCGRLDLFGREPAGRRWHADQGVNNKDRNFTRNSLAKFIRGRRRAIGRRSQAARPGRWEEDGMGGGARTNNLAGEDRGAHREAQALCGDAAGIGAKRRDLMMSLTDPDRPGDGRPYEGRLSATTCKWQSTPSTS